MTRSTSRGEDHGAEPTVTLRRLFEHVLSELDVDGAMRAVGRQVDDILGRDPKPIRLVTFGKAGVPMTDWFLGERGDAVVEGLAAVPECKTTNPRVRCYAAGHPVPNGRSLRAGADALEMMHRATRDDDVVFLISGGGSALLEAPVYPSLSLDDMRLLNDVLVSCGADIVEMNIVRKHLSALKGGRLAEAAYPARQLTLFISDVPEGCESSVASGPTMPDESTLVDFHEVLLKYRLEEKLPPRVRSLIEGRTLPETPKPGDRCFERAHWISVLENRHALEAAKRFAEKRGWQVVIDTSVDDARLSVAADHLLGRLRELRAASSDRPVCVISGGELSSPRLGRGGGGRNQAFVLECVPRIAGERVAVISAGTDGIDGNSPAAGAVADGTTLARARGGGMDPTEYGAQSDSYSFFKRLGDDMTCGPTHNNVRDLRVLVAMP